MYRPSDAYIVSLRFDWVYQSNTLPDQRASFHKHVIK